MISSVWNWTWLMKMRKYHQKRNNFKMCWNKRQMLCLVASQVSNNKFVNLKDFHFPESQLCFANFFPKILYETLDQLFSTFEWKTTLIAKAFFRNFDRSFSSKFCQFIIERWKWLHIILSIISLSNFVNHLVAELLIISVLSILFNTYNLTNVYSKANATVQNSSDLRSIRKILEKN